MRGLLANEYYGALVIDALQRMHSPEMPIRYHHLEGFSFGAYSFDGDAVPALLRGGASRDATLEAYGSYSQAPAYMSPEQLLDENVDARADLYATGVVLYANVSLAGGRWRLTPPAVFIGKLLAETPPSPRDLNGDVPAPLSDLIMRTIAGDRNARPSSAAELRKQLARSDA